MTRSNGNRSLRSIVREKILQEMIQATAEYVKGWSVLVVDAIGTKIISNVLRMSDLHEHRVSLIEKFELNRQPFREMSVIYFIAGTTEAIQHLGRDFPTPETAKYAQVHLFFYQRAADEVIQLLQQNSVLVNRIATFKEINVDFLPIEPAIFTCDYSGLSRDAIVAPSALHTCFSPHSPPDRTADLIRDISSHLISVCASLNEYPYFRYYQPSTASKSSPSITRRLVEELQAQMNDFVHKNKDFEYRSTRATLLILDRSFDLITPLLHECTYQAVLNDVLPKDIVNGELVNHPIETRATGKQMKQSLLNENDLLWVEFRHDHLAQVTSELSDRMTSLKATSKAASAAATSSTETMANAVRELPEYQQQLSQLSQHIYLASQAMDYFVSQDLVSYCELEQNFATGLDESGKKISRSNLVRQALNLVSHDGAESNSTSSLKKTRLLTTILLSQSHSLSQQEKSEIQEQIKSLASNDQVEQILNLNAYIPLNNAAITQDQTETRSTKHFMKFKFPLKSKQEASPSTNEYASTQRYTPKLKVITQQLVQGKLPADQYPYLIAPPADYNKNVASSTGKTPVSLRKKKGKPASGPNTRVSDETKLGERMIVFIVGGATYSEMRSIYEIIEEQQEGPSLQHEVILGTTEVLTAERFFDELAKLKQPCAPKEPVEFSVASRIPIPASAVDSCTKTNQEKKKKRGVFSCFS